MSSESVHPTTAGKSSSVDPRTAGQGRRFVQRGKKSKQPDAAGEEPAHDAAAPPADEDDHQIDVLV